MKNLVLLILLTVLLWAPAPPAASQTGAAQTESAQTGSARVEIEEAHEGDVVEMTLEERRAAGIETLHIRRQALAEEVLAPGEAAINAYRSSKVTSRISAQVVARHARLGDEVARGDPLLTLSSVALAEAQGELLVTDRDWRRVESLGREVVSGRRYTEAQVAYQQAYARVRAFGMTEKQIEALLNPDGAARATGRFKILSPQAGTVLSDGFIVGEMIEPGRVLMDISDESSLWVEARLSPEDAAQVHIGDAARVKTGDGEWFKGNVVQVHHLLDEETRTRSVRIEVANQEDQLHPGEFVDVAIKVGGEGKLTIAVPEKAILLFEGKLAVFRVEGDDIHPVSIETGETRGGWTEIASGLAEGDEVAVSGVFLLKSLILKAEIGEGHVH
jgi:cobalt-zinc-cadmium efflux system membrane fusion protein